MNKTVIYGETISVTVQIQNKTKTSKTEVSNKLVFKNLSLQHLHQEQQNNINDNIIIKNKNKNNTNKLMIGNEYIKNIIYKKTNISPIEIDYHYDNKVDQDPVAFVTFESVQNAIEAKNKLNAMKFILNNREIIENIFNRIVLIIIIMRHWAIITNII